MSERVVVIGAGVAGLAAARALRNSAPDIEIVVLEAQRRCGGLVETVRSPPGFVIEHGADSVVTTKPRGIAAIRAAVDRYAGNGSPPFSSARRQAGRARMRSTKPRIPAFACSPARSTSASSG